MRLRKSEEFSEDSRAWDSCRCSTAFSSVSYIVSRLQSGHPSGKDAESRIRPLVSSSG